MKQLKLLFSYQVVVSNMTSPIPIVWTL